MSATPLKARQDTQQEVGKLTAERRPLTHGDRRSTSFIVLGPRIDSGSFYSTVSLPAVSLIPDAAGEDRTSLLPLKSEVSDDETFVIPPKRKSRCDPAVLWRSNPTITVDVRSSFSAGDGELSGVGKNRQRPMRSMTSSSLMERLPRLPPGRSLSRNGLEWMQKTEIYNVASTKLRSMLQKPAGSLDLKSVPEGVFAGPLLEIFPDSAFPRPSRANQTEWDEVMGVGKWRYPAEDSGLVTFWQAILVNVHWLRCGLGAMLALTSRGCHTAARSDPVQLSDCLTYPMGQLVNAIGLSWEYHHVRNLKKMDEADRQRINIPSLSHRHESLKRKSWAVLLKLQGLACLKIQAERVEAVRGAHKKFEDFYIYLIYTIRIIMEDTLFLYRSSLNEQQLSCLGDTHGILSDSSDAELIQQACMLMAGGTPPSHWKRRFDNMGHGWLARQTTLNVGLMRYQRMFLNPIKQVQKASQAFNDVSPEI